MNCDNPNTQGQRCALAWLVGMPEKRAKRHMFRCRRVENNPSSGVACAWKATIYVSTMTGETHRPMTLWQKEPPIEPAKPLRTQWPMKMDQAWCPRQPHHKELTACDKRMHEGNGARAKRIEILQPGTGEVALWKSPNPWPTHADMGKWEGKGQKEQLAGD